MPRYRRTGLRMWHSICCCQRHAAALSLFAMLTGMHHGAAPILSLCLSDALSNHDGTFAPCLKLALLLKEFYNRLSTVMKAGKKLQSPSHLNRYYRVHIVRDYINTPNWRKSFFTTHTVLGKAKNNEKTPHIPNGNEDHRVSTHRPACFQFRIIAWTLMIDWIFICSQVHVTDIGIDAHAHKWEIEIPACATRRDQVSFCQPGWL